MASRTDTSVSLNLNRGNKDEGGPCEVSWHALHDSVWVSKEGNNSSGSPFTCSGLQPGTKYVFQARAGTFFFSRSWLYKNDQTPFIIIIIIAIILILVLIIIIGIILILIITIIIIIILIIIITIIITTIIVITMIDLFSSTDDVLPTDKHHMSRHHLQSCKTLLCP